VGEAEPTLGIVGGANITNTKRVARHEIHSAGGDHQHGRLFWYKSNGQPLLRGHFNVRRL